MSAAYRRQMENTATVSRATKANIPVNPGPDVLVVSFSVDESVVVELLLFDDSVSVTVSAVVSVGVDVLVGV